MEMSDMLRRQKDDPTSHLRSWLRDAGLHSLEYPLIELDRMPSLAELVTWSFEDLQLLNLTDADRFALFAHLSQFQSQQQKQQPLAQQQQTNAKALQRTSQAPAPVPAASASGNVNASSEDDDDEDDEEDEENYEAWLGELEYLGGRLKSLGVRSRADLALRLPELPLSIAERDALERMLEQNVVLFRRPLCKSYLGNTCSAGIKCKFLHSRPCRFTESQKQCPFAESCPYLHPSDKGYASARERPCRFVAAGEQCHLGEKCHYLHNISGWRIQAGLQDGSRTSQSEDADASSAVAASASSSVLFSSDSNSVDEPRKCSACGVSVSSAWAEHIALNNHRDRVVGRVRSVLERGLDMKSTTVDLVMEAFGSWAALVKERSDLFYLDQGAIQLRKSRKQKNNKKPLK